jgi:membrane-associated phospholipid phosphatase
MKQEVTGPFHTAKKTWIRVGAFAALEGVLIFADKPIKRLANDVTDNNPGVRNVSEYVTNFGADWEGYTLALLGAYGFIFKNNKVKTTTLLATQSYLASAAMSTLVKFGTGRMRPKDFAEGEENNLIFRGPSSTSTGSSFPSGHTQAAFSAATVFAVEYQDQPWVPILAYSAATLVGLSRITQNAHWATDVVAGAALGYVTGKQVVRNYHRYAKIQNAKAKRTSLLFNMQYVDGVFMPGVVYRF